MDLLGAALSQLDIRVALVGCFQGGLAGRLSGEDADLA
jgi:hypothetical protein